MTDEQLKLLERYREGWVKLNAAEAAKADIERYIRDLQREQRELANKVASLGDPYQKPAKICISCSQLQGQPHLDWCPVVTGTLTSIPRKEGR